MLPPGTTERNQYIIDSIANHGSNVEYTWAEVVVPTDDGTDLRIHVFDDAMKVDGVRVGVSARVTQQVADMIGAVLCTPKMADLIFLARQRTAVPHPQGTAAMTATSTMETMSKQIDADLARSGGSGIASTVGKYWCLSNRNTASNCINYGWHVMATGSWGGIHVSPCVSGVAGVSVIQGAAASHNYDWGDYSQTIVLAHADCMVNGSPRKLADVLRDPSLARFLSHEGPLNEVRLPVGEAAYTGDFGGSAGLGGGALGRVWKWLAVAAGVAAGWWAVDNLAA